MEIPVLVEKLADGRYVARGLGLCAEGPSDYHARYNLQEQIDRIVMYGGRVMSVVVPDPPSESPLTRMAGSLDPNDPMVQEWQRAVEEYRRQVDADPDRP